MTWLATYSESVAHYYAGLDSVCKYASIHHSGKITKNITHKTRCPECKNTLASNAHKRLRVREARLKVAQRQARKKFGITLEEMLLNRLDLEEGTVDDLRELFSSEFRGVFVEDLLRNLAMSGQVTITDGMCTSDRRMTHVA